MNLPLTTLPQCFFTLSLLGAGLYLVMQDTNFAFMRIHNSFFPLWTHLEVTLKSELGIRVRFQVFTYNLSTSSWFSWLFAEILLNKGLIHHPDVFLSRNQYDYCLDHDSKCVFKFGFFFSAEHFTVCINSNMAIKGLKEKHKSCEWMSCSSSQLWD